MEQSPSPSELLFQLRNAARVYESVLSEYYAPFGHGLSRIDVLELLAGSLECGSQSEVAGMLHLSESSICALIDRMQGDGLLVRQRSVTDRRRSVLALSERGHALLREVLALRDHRLGQTFHDWPGARLSDISTSLQSISDVLAKSLTSARSHTSRERAA